MRLSYIVLTLLGVAAIATPLDAHTPARPPAPITTTIVERYIACYPRVDAVRSRFREEAARLTKLHEVELDRFRAATRDPDGSPNLQRMDAYSQVENYLVKQPAADLIFLPVLRVCGFESIDAYAAAMSAIIYYYPLRPDWLLPYLDRVDGLRVPNLN